MSKTNEITVVFLREKEDADVFAYFPNEEADRQGNKMCYAHIGQHSACHPDYAAKCKPASETEYSDLLAELHSIGYDNLKVMSNLYHRYRI